MVRLRWFEPEPDDASTPTDWRLPALVMATLFLNLSFWQFHYDDVPMLCPLPLYSVLVGAAALMLTGVLFLGPALAIYAAKRPLLGAIENSLGSIPAFVLRICCVSFLALWVADQVAMPAWMLSSILRRDVSSTETALASIAIVVFLLVTGLQGPRTSAKLSMFTYKLGIAILVAAILRVYGGWAAVWSGGQSRYSDPPIATELEGISRLAFYLAPLALLAAGACYRSRGQQQVAMTAVMGIAFPLFGTLLLMGVISVAKLALHQPGGDSSVGEVLVGHAVAKSALPPRLMILAITTFGAGRFGVRALAESASVRSPAKGWRLVLLVCVSAAMVWLSVHGSVQRFPTAFEVLGTCLAVTGAVLTADVVIGLRRIKGVRRIDWVGVTALIAGLATPLYFPRWILGTNLDSWWHPWLLPSYAVGFLVCLVGRVLQKTGMAHDPEGQS